MKKILSLILLSAIFIFASCGGGDETTTKCTTDSECTDGKTCNTSTGVCEEGFICTNNRQCDPGEVCNLDNGNCEKVFICSTDQGCYDHDSTWNEDTNPVMCVMGVCKSKGCKSDSDCSGGNLCNVASGKCEVAQDCSLVSEIQIVTPSPVLTEGATKELKAVSLNRNGFPINTGSAFTWASTKTDTVAVDTNGVITGGTVSGSSDITVSVCDKTSAPLNVQNFATVEANKLRVIVRDIDGNKIVGSTVKVGSTSLDTDTEGSVLFDNSEAKNNITITMNGFQAVSLLEVSEKDVIVYLNKMLPTDKAGGFKGSFDFNDSSIVNNGDTQLGFAGVSLPGNILDLDFGLLLGEPIMRHIEAAGISQDLALPSGLVLMLGEDNPIASSYATTGVEGDRIFWGWGGRASLAQVIAMVQESVSGGMDNLDIGKLLSQLMPIAEKFNHSIKANQTVTTCPKVVDTEDINGNENTTELIADFNSSCFPTVNMTLNQPLSQFSTIKFPLLPTIEGEKTEFTVLLAATIVEGKGMVPLGMGAGTDKVDNNDVADGKVNDVNLVYAPQHDGIANNDSIVVFITTPINADALNPESNTELNSLSVALSGIVKLYKNGVIEDNIDLSNDSYLALAEDATLTNNTISFSPISGANLYRVSVTGVNGNNWLVYSPSTTISIEDSPIGNVEHIIVQAISLTKDSTPLSYNDLVKFNSSNLDDLVRLISKFSAYQVNLTAK